jgi:hypothetical protein
MRSTRRFVFLSSLALLVGGATVSSPEITAQAVELLSGQEYAGTASPASVGHQYRVILHFKQGADGSLIVDIYSGGKGYEAAVRPLPGMYVRRDLKAEVSKSPTNFYLQLNLPWISQDRPALVYKLTVSADGRTIQETNGSNMLVSLVKP